jgi:hypothetical protein
MQNVSIYERALSVYKLPTCYMGAQPKVKTQKSPGPEEKSSDGDALQPEPAKITEKWQAAEVFARKATETAALEKEFCVVYERRRTTAMRLSDCVKRHEDQSLEPLAKEWLRSEQKVYALQQKYSSVIEHREKMLKACGLGADDDA